jgi:hypothetical protein
MDIQEKLWAGQEGLYLYLGRPTIPRLRNIILLVCCPSCIKRCKNVWPGISGMSHCGISTISIRIRLQTREVRTNRNAPCGYTYTVSRGKRKLTLKHRNLIKSPHAMLPQEIIFTGDFASWTCILLMYAWKTNKYTNYSFTLLIMYHSSYMFRHYIAIFREHS